MHFLDERLRRALVALCGTVSVALAVGTAAGATPAPGPAKADKADQPDKPAAAPRRAGDRTLDAITIEGEIAVPQVLFITSREQPRYRDLLHRRFLRTSLDVGEHAILPSRVLIKE